MNRRAKMTAAKVEKMQQRLDAGLVSELYVVRPFWTHLLEPSLHFDAGLGHRC
jgi:hypothetical protein